MLTLLTHESIVRSFENSKSCHWRTWCDPQIVFFAFCGRDRRVRTTSSEQGGSDNRSSVTFRVQRCRFGENGRRRCIGSQGPTNGSCARLVGRKRLRRSRPGKNDCRPSEKMGSDSPSRVENIRSG